MTYNLVAAMELYYPLTQGVLILTGAAAAGLRTVTPVHSWPPLPAEVALGAAAILWARGEKEVAVATLLGFHFDLIISEIVSLTVELVVLPTDSTCNGVGSELAVTVKEAKTGMHQSVNVDDPLVDLLKEIKGKRSSGARLFENLTYGQFRDYSGKRLHA